MSTVPPAQPQPPFPPPWPSATGPAPSHRPRRTFAISLGLGLIVGIGVGIGLMALHASRSAPSAPAYSAQQVSNAKDQVCSAYAEVHKEVTTNSARDQGTDPIQQLAVTATIRQAFLAGSTYLLTTLSEQPATPSELAKPVRQLAIAYQEVTVGYLNGKANADMEATLRAGDDAAQNIQRLCS